MSGSIDVKGLPEALTFIDEFSRIDLRDRLREASVLVRDVAKGMTHSRRVRAAMGFSVSVKGLNQYQAEVGPSRKTAWFAHFLEFGTRPHQIARGARAPQSVVTKSGRIRRRRGHVIAGSRIHPGARARPFLLPAAEATEDQIVDIVGKAFVYTGVGEVHNP